MFFEFVPSTTSSGREWFARITIFWNLLFLVNPQLSNETSVLNKATHIINHDNTK